MNIFNNNISYKRLNFLKEARDRCFDRGNDFYKVWEEKYKKMKIQIEFDLITLKRRVKC